MDIVRSVLLSQFPELVHGFATKEWGNMSFRRDWDGKAKQNNVEFLLALGIDPTTTPILDPCLNHGNNVALLESRYRAYRLITLNEGEVQNFSYNTPIVPPDPSLCPPDMGIDACWTGDAGACLTMRPADCAIVMVYDPRTRTVGLLHAGTVGVLAEIIPHAIESVTRWRNVNPRFAYCFVGPSICREAYDLTQSGLWRSGHLKRVISESQAQEYDPKARIRLQLLSCGIPDAHIEISQECTASQPDRYFSHSAAGTKEERKRLGRMLAVIGLRR